MMITTGWVILLSQISVNSSKLGLGLGLGLGSESRFIWSCSPKFESHLLSFITAVYYIIHIIWCRSYVEKQSIYKVSGPFLTDRTLKTKNLTCLSSGSFWARKRAYLLSFDRLRKGKLKIRIWGFFAINLQSVTVLLIHI